MRFFRIIIFFATIFALQNIATFLIPVFSHSTDLKNGVPVWGISMIIGFLCIPFSAPFLWCRKKIGIYILIFGTLCVTVAAVFSSQHDSIIQLLISPLSFGLLHIILLITLIFCLPRFSQKNEKTEQGS